MEKEVKEMVTVRVTKIRVPHECDACGAIMPTGTTTFTLYRWRKGRKFPVVYYLHHNPEVDPNEIPKMSGIEIRKRCCAYNLCATH